MRRFAALLGLAMLVLAGCGGSSGASTSSKGTIAFSYGNETAGIYPLVANPAKKEAEKRGYKFIQGSASGKCEKQVQDLQNFIAQKVKAIVFLPLCGVDPYKNVIQQAKAAGIVVIGYSQSVPGGDAALTYDNIQGATDVANYAIKWYQSSYTGDKAAFKWALFTYDQCGRPCTERTDTLRSLVVKATGVKPLEAESVAEDSGLSVTQTLLQRAPTLNMVLGINDAGALGAAKALSQQIQSTGRDAKQVMVAGMDGQNDALKLIADGGGPNGIYRASGAIVLTQLGQDVADLPINILEGQPSSSVLFPYTLLTVDDKPKIKTILDEYNKFLKS